jgi:WD40 repeat protein
MLAISLTGNGLYQTRPGAGIWNVARGRMAATLPPDIGGGEVVYSPAGKTLAIFDEGGTAYLWDIATKAIKLTLRAPESTGVCYGGDAATFSPDGKMLATADGCANDSAFLWDTNTGRHVAALTGRQRSRGWQPRIQPRRQDSGYRSRQPQHLPLGCRHWEGHRHAHRSQFLSERDIGELFNSGGRLAMGGCSGSVVADG